MLTRLQPFFDERFVFATLTQLKKTSTAPYKKCRSVHSCRAGNSPSS